MLAAAYASDSNFQGRTLMRPQGKRKHKSYILIYDVLHLGMRLESGDETESNENVALC
jgi:hypothetical protein